MASKHGHGRQPQANDWQLYRRLMSYVLPYWYIFAFSLGGFIIYSMGNVLLADLMQFLLDSLNDSDQADSGIVAGFAYRVWDIGDMSKLEFARVAVPVAMVVLASTRAMGFFVGTYFMNHIARNLVHKLRCQLFDKMLQAPSAYYDTYSQGVLISKITYNVEQVTGAATKALKIVVREGLTVVALLGYMLYLNWRLCLVFFAVAPLIALVVTVVGKHFRRYSRRIQSSMGDVTQVSNESIGAYKEVRLFGGQAQQGERFRSASEYNINQSLKLAFADALSTPVIQTLLATALAALVWFALNPSILSGFSAGSLVAFLTAAGQLGKPIRQLSGIQSVIQRGLAACEDIFDQLDQESEIDNGSYQVERAEGRIEFRDLSFAYPGTEQNVLSQINLEIPAGDTVALVGRSGSGKSTIVQLLARFYPVEQGTILLDGKPLPDYQLANLRQQLAMVSQDVTLFHDTVYNNIAYGCLADTDRDTVMAAVELANAKHFIEQLPEGFDTMLGDDGGGLSGGQRQRIAIARAILKDAPILILDEATSALDNESEHRIQRALENVMSDRTTVIIAHRLSTVERADHIVVMDEGRIVAKGSHAELLQQNGLYAQLYHQEFSD
ncbi:lipid A export permease/ATP-binding protein MsbA [Parahaliea sp. F7430]|uniref:Lipid A export permease/ATP-binding protein MsbA n=1 Tax=Sediminihaliea albiluteola TaxID=2758564 RepID=A0A7W2TUE8_9GAMM|nr:lipid A export permease/ATP-binding protein MsbA [Sediminihaliea albiluteola]MBA6412127.1 lipid A export permease/ATP-binding protein MsbA [Sediminihaliea albiluteola]